MRRPALLLCCSILALGPPALGAGRMRSGGSDLRITAQKIRVDIEDAVATTEVEQEFANDTDSPVEAIYEFPLPEGGTFSGLSVWVDGEEIQGEVVARSRAEEVYGDVTGIQVRREEEQRKQAESIRAQGQARQLPVPQWARRRARRFRLLPVQRHCDPGLLQLKGRSLRLRVAPVPAQGTYKVKVRYLQPVVCENREGRYVYPLAQEAGDAPVAERLECEVQLSSTRPLTSVSCPSHAEAVLEPRLEGAVYRLRLDQRDARLDRDVELRFELAEVHHPELQLKAARTSADDGTVQLTLTPWLPPGSQETGRDVLFVVDRSESMAQRRTELLAALDTAMACLSPRDRFDVVAFHLSADAWSRELKPATKKNLRAGFAFAKNQSYAHTADPTCLIKAAAQIGKRTERLKPIDAVLLSDANLSDTPGLLRSLEVKASQVGLRVFALELGNGRTPQAPLARLAFRTGAVARSVDRERPRRTAHQVMKALEIPVIRSPRLRLEGIELTSIHPAEPPHVLPSGTPIQLYGRYAKAGRGRAVLEGTLPDGRRTRWVLPVELPERSDHLDVQRLWSQAAADDLLDSLAQGDLPEAGRRELERDLLEVSLAGPILTRATSLLVLESEAMFQDYGISRENKQQIAAEKAAELRRRQKLDADIQRRNEEQLQIQAQELRSLDRDPEESYASAGTGWRRPKDLWALPKGGGGVGGGFGGGGGGGAGDPVFLILAACGVGAAIRRRRRRS